MLSLAVLLMLKIPNEAFLWITRYLVERHEQKKNFVCSISLSVSLPVCLSVHYSIHLSIRLTFCLRPTLLGGGGGGSALWVKRVWNRCIHFIDKNLFPISSGAREWASDRANERSGAREWSKWCGTSEWLSGASERANGRANGPASIS